MAGRLDLGVVDPADQMRPGNRVRGNQIRVDFPRLLVAPVVVYTVPQDGNPDAFCAGRAARDFEKVVDGELVHGLAEALQTIKVDGAGHLRDPSLHSQYPISIGGGVVLARQGATTRHVTQFNGLPQTSPASRQPHHHLSIPHRPRPAAMIFLSGSKLLAAGLLLCQWTSALQTSWTFVDATLQLSQKGGEAGPKQVFTPKSPISGPLTLKTTDTIKILLTAKEGDKAKRPHQIFLLAKDAESGLETFFPFDVKESGKARLDLTQKEIPLALLTSPSLTLTVAIGSFGQATPLSVEIATVNLSLDAATKKSLAEPPLKYGKLNEIHHIFRPEPRSPPKIISLVFLVGVLACLPALFGAWFALSANVSHLPKALAASPIAQPVFFLSLLAFEGVFFAYYTKINIFQALAAVAIISPVTMISGSRALREVRARRLNGER
ncbi:hypothetical protein H072_3939 [Dactylellina haptotyla CBS 200.50]|uniref:Ribophorin II C-terminal domain-containing protein n=1 Tax=Dactylellina haptotyla (strain CBS 200.50) TaxID=1284197 RepID=S8AM58_DACHA|nr:hypothetical protein H072_3939 [Dactylellina haptotyla CBS 200.50]